MQTVRNKQVLTLNGRLCTTDSLLKQIENESAVNKAFLQELYNFLVCWFDSSETLAINTSGSTGTPKTIIVRKQNMIESARMTCEFLQLKPGNIAFLCMPLQYIAGKMMIVRALVAQLDLRWQVPSGNPLTDVDYHIHFAAMVPSQVYNVLKDEKSKGKLLLIENLIIGGGAISPELEKDLHNLPGKVYSTYGMTETLSHIALRKINEPHAQAYYQPFPSVELSLDNDSTLIINAPLICDVTLKTNDVAHIHVDGTFQILGRKDNIINCGGIKIQIEEIEKQLTQLIKSAFCITSVPSSKWGEEIVLFIEDTENEIMVDRKLISTLPKYWQPHYIHVVNHIPLTETGKINRAACRQLAISKQKNGLLKE